jgi:Zn-dependent protease
VGPEFLLSRLMLLVPLLLSLTVHEFAHAWSAWHLGDDTAARQGRLTLNPLSHIDPFGTLLLPLLGVPFGWAKPVPIDPAQFTRKLSMRTGMMVTAAAGPISNILLAVLSTLAYGLLFRFAPETVSGRSATAALLGMMIQINVVLALFNMLPVYPLDGSRVVDGLLPARMRPAWENINRFAPFLLLGVIVFGGSIISGPRMFVDGLLRKLLLAVAL